MLAVLVSRLDFARHCLDFLQLLPLRVELCEIFLCGSEVGGELAGLGGFCLLFQMASRRRKSDGETIRMPRNSRSASRCFLSPLTM